MKRALLLLACGALAACTPGVEDLFFVRQGGADLPVWLQGARDAQTFIVMQHGSGASGKVYDWMPSFGTLEQRYAIVYWDQRGAGISQGNAAEPALTLDASVQDLDAVLTAVRHRYRPKRLVLMGHSLGGGLSLAYLREPARAQGIAGYIDVCGGRSLPEAYAVTRSRMQTEGTRFADDTSRPLAERDSWRNMVAFYDAHPDFPRQEPDRTTHGKYVDAVLAELGYDSRASTAALTRALTQRGFDETMFGTFDALAYGANTASFLTRFDHGQVMLTAADVSTIPLSALVVAGRFDFAVPVPVPQATWEAFASSKPFSRFVVLEQSGHFPMWDEPEAFAQAVAAFVDELP